MSLANANAIADEAAIWRPIAADEYTVPAQDPREGLVSRWQRLWRRQEPSWSGDLVSPERLPSDVVTRLVPTLDLEAGAARLGEELAGWLVRAPAAARSVALIGPPGSAVQDVLETWAGGAEVQRLEAPSRDERDAGSWDPILPADDTVPLVLPPLERLFLRRVGGLEPLRRLLERLQREGRAFACACDSWSWKYLSHTLPHDAGFDRVIAPAPFTAIALRSWLRELDAAVDFVDGKTKDSVLAPGEKAHAFLRALAAHSRGIPGVAAAIWKLALCEALRGTAENNVRRCVLPPWQELCTPQPAQKLNKPVALVLHALLLHGGLDEGLLTTVVPLPASVLQALLWELRGNGTLAQLDGSWHVTASGYPAVRSKLAALNLGLDFF